MTAIAAAAAFVAILVAPASAVQYGQPDGNGHPWVGLVSFHDAKGVPLWRCTGSLIDADTFLTAGHCTEAPAAKAVIWFDAGPINITNGWTSGRSCKGLTGYPCTGDATGTPISHPNWNGALTIPNTNDVGVVQLNEAVTGRGFGSLAGLNYLDSLASKRGTQDVEFTVVGYGLQLVKPRQSAVRERMVGTVHLVNLRSALTDGYNIHYSSNPGEGHGGSGGTCFGDSGGPVIHNGKIVGVNSFVLNLNCKGSAFAYRVDIENSRSFLDDYTRVP